VGTFSTPATHDAREIIFTAHPDRRTERDARLDDILL
jgi:hypothetical protein